MSARYTAVRNSPGRSRSARSRSESVVRSSASASAEGTGGCLLWLTAPLAVYVDERGGQDPVQPRPQVGARSELLKRCVGLDRSLLDEVFRVGRVPRHPECSRV